MRTDVQQTSIRAYDAIRYSGLGTQQCALILNFIKARGGGWSIGELSHELGLQKSTVSARVNELLNNKLLVAFAPRKDRCSGITVRPVGLDVFAQGELF